MSDSHLILPKLDHIPAHIVSAGDYEQAAQDYMPENIYAAIAGGSADELTLRENCRAFESIELIPAILQEFSSASTATTLLDQCHALPFLLAPIAHQQLVHPEGELATLAAANALNIPMVCSTLASTSLEDVAAQAEVPLWFQLYFQETRDATLSLVKRAEQSGYRAIVVTVDAPLSGLRNRAQRAGYVLPSAVPSANLVNKPAAPPISLAPDQSLILHGLMSEAPTWSDIEWLQQHTHLPIIVKGVLSPGDAVRCRQLGLAGVVVSNHGGRTLDGVPASIRALPAVRQAVGDDVMVLLDSGIRRGSDIFKALALGADAVLIGRPYLYALAVAGALGVAHLLRTLKEELEITMALTGCPTIDSIQANRLNLP
ncbi:alpha-hydroxy-acid oxidizing protein [Aestuariicella hydrocarbonica]|uniref:Alpha-hydroxy-acid oxidizing protein n=1 Tax=Pseudomaricurvus hydrocarbonicus TaxID=1470433 RepID=A0A9E5JQK5_9GAMM|nr:alpha-hydroxy acid oxidase [Aestuariicella hydrocarbonica]NHO64863.1 alpha-hydroxy-acid oxidizing protein [Aestuariicella hydrocarbonica]